MNRSNDMIPFFLNELNSCFNLRIHLTVEITPFPKKLSQKININFDEFMINLQSIEKRELIRTEPCSERTSVFLPHRLRLV